MLRRWPVLTLVFAVGCYMSHERDDRPAPDAGAPVVDAAPLDAGPPPRDAEPDAGPGCADGLLYERTDVRPGVVRPGRMAEVDGFIVWIPNQSRTRMAWYERSSGTLRSETIDDVYSQEAHVVATPGAVVAAWERTGERGRATGVRVGTFARAPGPPLTLVEVSATGGQPFLAHGPRPDVALLVYQDPGVHVLEIDVVTGEPRGAPLPIDGDTRRGLGAAATDDAYFVASAGAIYRLDPDTLTPTRLASTGLGRPMSELAATDDRLLVGSFDVARSYTLDGALVAERPIEIAPPASDVWVAGRGRHALVSARLPGEAMITDEDLEVVQRLEPLADNPRLAPTSTGFVALGTDRTVSDARLTFLDACP